MSQSVKKKRHMNGLDGLRAIAVLGVIAYHLNLDFIPGGLLGVGIFFVLSGYLITDILLSQWREHGRIALGDFWLRRFRRLLPGMLTMTAVVMLWLLCTDSSRLASLKGDILSGVTYISNWWYIFHHVSYFESFGPPSPFGHFWSLAVEEQFYLLWPLLLIAAIVLFKRKGWLVVSIVVAAELSAGAMAIMYNPDLDPSRVYYGTDTRAFALLAGAALAVVWPSRKLSGTLPAMNRLVLDVSGIAALAVLIYMMLNTSEYDSFLYQGGMVIQAIAATLLVAVLAHPSSLLARIIGAKPLRWIGERSYGIYLWHYPIIVLTSPVVNTGGAHPVRMLLQVVATVVLASMSLKYIENPIRYNGFRDSLSKLWGRGRTSFVPRQVWWKRTGLLMTFLLLCYAISQTVLPVAANSDSHSVSLSTVFNGEKSAEEKGQDVVPVTTKPSDSEEKNPSVQSGTESTSDGKTNGSHKPGTASTDGSKSAKPDDSSNDSRDQGNSPSNPDNNPASNSSDSGNKETDPSGSKPDEGTTDATDSGATDKPATPVTKNEKVQYTIIGDSVILDAKPYLEQSISGVYVDGHVGRQMWQAGDVLRDLKRNKQMGNQVVLELGTNGSFNSKNLKSVLDGLKDKTRVYLVTVRVPRPWERTVNKALTDAASSYSNVSLIDWNQASEGHDEYFEKDGVHLTAEGSEAFAALVKNSLQ
ncbi:Peptidoglycan/LPS O-acetylase OafA/YrhL, contains acyltransferase and SGNH-hydrolase domains [Paenibacillus polysaccharolyticus]|uniref:Peptidoglycan/LPS O-acetylase OafA/YrhL, contains acyltransferase and SGNH-hydrolase domains n=1 Tax=Paenibacillus polysaccharolyticus TaxID=582692 RepID=A0A1G5L994_9BACL|nr:acyltransferase family protein [Paenibacillus polysaccharolyticus]SCZ09465.1 Peptidoglycan/LPS O-acetylase OafA/YrhL, contains acyltransferase and SGNH-hydrolase domains [Paenibacillus polysaccharolyticus]